MDGAAGVLLTRKMLGDSAWQMALFDHVSASGSIQLPEAWQESKSLNNALADDASLSTLLLPYAFQHLSQKGDADKILVTASIENRGAFALGFQRVSK